MLFFYSYNTELNGITHPKCFLRLSVFLSHFTLTVFIIGHLFWARRERHPWQYPEVGVQRGRHDQALWRGHRCNGHFCHIRGGNIQWLCFTGRPNPPHLSNNKQISKCFCYFFSHINPLSSTERQPTQLRLKRCAEMCCATVPVQQKNPQLLF